MIRIAVIVANKSEDSEVIVPIDIWRRAGIFVRTLSVDKKKNLFLAHGIKISCDTLLSSENLSKYDAIYLPGGPGYVNYNDDMAPRLISFLEKNGSNSKMWFLAMCAAPQVYGCMGMLDGVKATCYPGYEEPFKATYVKTKDVVVDKNFITANSMSAAIEFALTVISKLVGKAKAKEVAKSILYKGKFE